jgi:hypothetical protein
MLPHFGVPGSFVAGVDSSFFLGLEWVQYFQPPVTAQNKNPFKPEKEGLNGHHPTT